MKKLLLVLLTSIVSFEIKAKPLDEVKSNTFEWCGFIPVYIDQGKPYFLLRKSESPSTSANAESNNQKTKQFLSPPLDHLYFGQKRRDSELLIYCDYLKRLINLDLSKKDGRKQNIYYMGAVADFFKGVPYMSYSIHKNQKAQKANNYQDRCFFKIAEKSEKVENNFDESNKPALFDGNFYLFGCPIRETETKSFRKQEGKQYTVYFIPVKQKKWGDADLDENTQWFSVEDIKGLKNSSEFLPSFFIESLNHMVSLESQSTNGIIGNGFKGESKKSDSLMAKTLKEQLKKFSSSPVEIA
jgi:hypothetical protein